MPSEAAAEPTDAEIIQAYRERRATARPDMMLNALVDVADAMDDFGMSLTVTVPGGVVAGLLINYPTWLDLVIADGGPWAAVVTPFQAEEAKRRQALADVDKDDEDDLMPPYLKFLHMRDARFVSGGLIPTSQVGMLWRGRLSEVSSWAIGSLKEG